MYHKGQGKEQEEKRKLKPFLFVSSGWGCAGALVIALLLCTLALMLRPQGGLCWLRRIE
jgi:hypothetical protein